ncbi:MAG: histidine--tRNA ligase [Endomicrobiia bacterium]
MAELKFKKVRGTRDILPEESILYRIVEKTACDIFEESGFSEIKIPTFEEVGIFIHSTGETTDIVQKEMYVFQDKKGRTLALRPEGTPGVVRAYLENSLNQKLPISRFYYAGQMFRYERPQEGRYREFYQIGCEYFGNSSSSADAEIILLMKNIYDRLGITNLKIELNSIGCENCRGKYRSALIDFLEKIKNGLCDDCKIRIIKNPLRVLDCKKDSEKFTDKKFPKITDFLCENCSKHFNEVQELLSVLNIDFILKPNLVRGLDYYTRTVFEAKVGESEAIAAGGRYDNLVEQLGGEKTPAIGFAIGVERTVEILKNFLHIPKKNHVVIVVQQEPEIIKKSFEVLKKIQKEKIPVIGPYSDRSLKAQMRIANSINARFVLIFGKNEIQKNAVILRNMTQKTQEEVDIENITQKLKMS